MRIASLAAALSLLPAAAAAQEPARALFSAVAVPAAGPAQVHGSYAKGCIAGAVPLPASGPGWQTMRPGRNRAWGHPEAVAVIGRLGAAALALGWPGLLIGDVSQPRGGPMPFGHASHQIGLDIDVWLMRPGARPLSRAEREGLSAVNAVAPDRRRVSPAWTEDQARIVMAAAQDAAVARIFVNAAIKAELCRWAPPGPRDWLGKVRPWWGHDHHFHVRLHCPADSPGCAAQEPPPPGDGCDAALDWWFSDEALHPPPPSRPPRPKPPLTLADLPPACAAVLRAR
mgnify:CR=1 FL=1